MLNRSNYAGALATEDLSSSGAASSLKTDENEWLTSEEAARYLRISEPTLRNMTSNGRIPYYKLGRSNRYLRSELRRFLLAHSKGVANGNQIR